LEYQGETHYFTSHIFGKATDRQRADELKANFAKQIGITVVAIPFWWDKSPHSLAHTIRLQRPDLNIPGLLYKTSIPSKMPAKFQKRFNYTPNVSKGYSDKVDPTGWYVDRKCQYLFVYKAYDGEVRRSASILGWKAFAFQELREEIGSSSRTWLPKYTF
jgi:hypothetical protein